MRTTCGPVVVSGASLVGMPTASGSLVLPPQRGAWRAAVQGLVAAVAKATEFAESPSAVVEGGRAAGQRAEKDSRVSPWTR
ncbi:hypothetical protein GCM10023235_55720 [Kitasatospora terrestris]|uniref:Uncharacterized protein n=1 Tax=Kitasatospora terrestris TaxID=258051 RepID=A0ABP9EDL8_9ACTN